MKADSISTKNLKIIKLSGGLGNQLFQYFFAYATFTATNDYILFDISDYFNGLAKRNFVLKKLGLPGRYFTCLKRRYCHLGIQYLDLSVLDVIGSDSTQVGSALRRLRLITEKEISYIPTTEYDLSGNVYIEGYWQSYRYWNNPKDFALNYLDSITRSQSSSLESSAPISNRSAQDICAIHFRRGDYNNEFNEQYHGKCEPEYFFHAMRLSGAKQFHIYSDDIVAAREVFGQFENVSLQEDSAHDEVEDFKALARYSKIIISNSSYSYLAAYFAFASHHAKIICPYPWYSFKETGPDIPPNWLALNRKTGSSRLEDARKINGTSISVIIPVHVRHQYIRDAVSSVLAQTIPVTEIILSLNGASCRARDEAHLMASLHCNIRIVESSTASLSLARNNGIRAAVGEYVAFLDDDDIWEPTKLAAQISAAIHTSSELVGTNYYKFDELGHKHFVSNLSSNRSNLWKYDLSVANYLSGGSAILIRREIFNNVGFFDEAMPSCEDHDMWRRAAVAGYKIHFIDDCLVGYRMNADNMTSKPHLMLQGELIHLSKILNEGDLYKSSAHKFYERIEELLAQYFEPPTARVTVHKTSSEHNISSTRLAFNISQVKFKYLLRLRSILFAGNLSEEFQRFFLKPQTSTVRSVMSLLVQLAKAIKIFLLDLPFEFINYFFSRIKNILMR